MIVYIRTRFKGNYREQLKRIYAAALGGRLFLKRGSSVMRLGLYSCGNIRTQTGRIVTDSDLVMHNVKGKLLIMSFYHDKRNGN